MGYRIPEKRMLPVAPARLSASFWGLWALFMACVLLFAGLGEHPTTPLQTLTVLLHQVGLSLPFPTTTHQVAALLHDRLPRVVLTIIVGAALGVAGTVTQGVFRNPLADPGLLGASSGAALSCAAATWLVDPLLHPWLAACTKPLLASLGALATVMLVYVSSRRRGTVLVATMMLAGLAVNAMAFALVGCITFAAEKLHVQHLVVWHMGSFADVGRFELAVTFVFVAAGCAVLPWLWQPLDTMMLGETQARHLGTDTRRTKMLACTVVALTTGASVAAVGFIAFVGLLVPHMSRLLVGVQHRILLPAAAVMGASVLLATDAVARTLVPAAEIPPGLLTTLIGAPFFLWLLICDRAWSAN